MGRPEIKEVRDTTTQQGLVARYGKKFIVTQNVIKKKDNLRKNILPN